MNTVRVLTWIFTTTRSDHYETFTDWLYTKQSL